MKVSPNRLLKYINLLIALLLCVFLGAAYWLAYRPLPKTSGTVAAPVRSKGAVSRDALGVAHIEAGTVEDALFLQGYVTAQDRLWQMDAMRRQAAGELAEILGRRALENDVEARQLRLRRLAEHHYGKLPANDRSELAAYARGVNHFLETHLGRLPLEFTLLGYHPRPWSARDSILVGLQMFRVLTSTWRDELVKHNLLEGGDPSKVNLLFPVGTGQGTPPGSNAWAISGARTYSGRPLLANDTHMQFTAPCAWYQIHLKAEGLNVAGMSLVGLPGVIIGHNERIAWGVTNLQFDVQDLYVEKLDPRTGEYAFQGRTEKAGLERELIPVKGERPVELSYWVTRHGPVYVSEGQRHYSLRWAAAELPAFEIPILEMNRAGNWGEFRAALARFPGPAQNFVYADVEGNIGYQAAGKLPIRERHAGDLPVDGASGEFEWRGFIPFERLPSVSNPASGMIVSANQNPFPEGYAYRVNGNFAPHYRWRQIGALLAARKKWTAEQMLAVQKDVYSSFHHFLAGQLVRAYDARPQANPALAEAIALLRGWDGQMEKGTAAPLVVTLAYHHFRKSLAERASPGKGAAYDSQMASAVVEQLLRDRPRDWFEDFDQALLRSFADALEEGRRMQGRDAGKWDYGLYNQLRLSPPVVGELPVLGKHFRIGPVSMSGSSTTVKQTSARIAPSARLAADASNWDASVANVTLGQSGQVLSPHYRDQWEAYYSGWSFPMAFDKVELKHRLEFVPEGR